MMRSGNEVAKSVAIVPKPTKKKEVTVKIGDLVEKKKRTTRKKAVPTTDEKVTEQVA